MTVTSYTVEPCDIGEVRGFVERWHYSGNVNGLRVTQCFALYDRAELIGGMIFGGMGMANAWRKYGDKETDVVELRRLCCVDDTPKNTESFFIGAALRWLRANTTIKVVVSYADTHQGHSGTIYKATNFEHVGMTAKSKVIHFQGREYHDKTIRTYYTNKHGVRSLKPFAQRIKDALVTGDAYYEERPPKHIYMMKLRPLRNNPGGTK